MDACLKEHLSWIFLDPIAVPFNVNMLSFPFDHISPSLDPV